MEIRKAEPGDITAIIALIREFAEYEQLADSCETTDERLFAALFGAQRFVRCLVAEADEGCVGYALFYPAFKSFRGERSMFLEDLYVTPAARGRGVGLALFSETARIAEAEGCARLDWQVLKWNTTAVEFYESAGAEFDDENLDFRLRGAAFKTFTRRGAGE